VNDSITGERWMKGEITGLEDSPIIGGRRIFKYKNMLMITHESFNNFLAKIEDFYSMPIEEISLGLLTYVTD
jgi:hypothetical protein